MKFPCPHTMIFREAQIKDINQIQVVRNSVKENVLSSPGVATDDDCTEFLTARGKGWVCEVDEKIVGFAIADVRENNIWALFVLPEYEGKGIGNTLHGLMLDWYFKQGRETVWLSTSPNTRAEKFYRARGWKEAGLHGKKEIKFIMTLNEWKNKQQELRV